MDVITLNAIEQVKLISDEINENKLNDYTTIYSGASSRTPTANIWYTVFDITGEGFIYQAVGYQQNFSSTSGHKYQAKITINGSVFWWSGSEATGSSSYNKNCMGISVIDYIKYGKLYADSGGTLESGLYTPQKLASYRIQSAYDNQLLSVNDGTMLSGNGGAVAIVGSPIYFSTSAKLEIATGNTTTLYDSYYVVTK